MIEELIKRINYLESRIERFTSVDKTGPYTHYAFYTRGTSNQSITVGTATIIDFNYSASDAFSLVTTGASWKYTVPATGLYIINANISWLSQTYEASDYVTFYINQNALGHVRNPYIYNVQSGHTIGLNFSFTIPMYLTEDDYISVLAEYESLSSTCAVVAEYYNSNITIFQLR